MRLAVLAVIASCSKQSSPPPAPQPTPPTVVQTIDAAAAKPLVTSHQLVTAITPDWSSTKAQLQLWERDGSGHWVPVLKPWSGVVGTGGTAWGVGVHGAGPPPGRTGPTKKEGDGKSPAGVFTLRDAYGYRPAKSGLPFHVVNSDWKCVDDPKSKQYNRVLDGKGVDKDWSSAEEMRRGDELYTLVVDIAHNPDATPGAGSCIFFHVWRDASSATVGCTAMPEARLAELIAKLEPSATYVLLPAAEYTALAPIWDLPR